LFFSDYLKSFVGDCKLQGTTDDDFEKLMIDAKSKNLLYLLLDDKK
jgi:hypothetical protein